MLMKYSFILLAAGLFFEKANAADSDGKDFVFTFVLDDLLELSPAATTTIIVIPSYNNTRCSITYTKNSDNKIVTLQEEALFGIINEITLNIKEVTTQFGYGYEFNAFNVKDFRIFVSCNEEIKLIGKIADPINAWGDHFLVPSLKNAATQYMFAMPTTDGYFKGTIGILPINKEGPISVKIDGYTNDVFFSTQTIEYNTTLGQSQYYIDSKFDELDKDDGTVIYNINVSIAITASSPVMLIFEAPFAQTSNVGEGGSCGTSCYYDSIQFMPISSQPLKCNSLLMPPDQRIITNDFTTRLHVYSPNLEADCYSITNITVYDGTNNVQGTSQIVDEMGFTKISLMNEGVVGFSTTGGQVPTNRFGSILGEDGITAFGHFMHYVPSISEWVTGKTQFFTLSNNCVIEFYTDSSNENLIKIDGKSLATLKYDRKSLPFFQNQYFQFIVKITGYGLHKIEHDAKYVAYVVCKHVNGPNNAAGYLTGFNQRKST